VQRSAKPKNPKSQGSTQWEGNKGFINYIVVSISMSEENQPREYKVKLKLASGARLEMRMFNDTEHTWTFKYRYVHPKKDEGLEKLALVNRIALVVDYNGGIAQGCNLAMDIVRPDKRGKEFFLGVDISEGSRLFAEFTYEKQGDLYRMKSANFGRHGRVDLDSLGEGLMKPIHFPFPLKDRLET